VSFEVDLGAVTGYDEAWTPGHCATCGVSALQEPLTQEACGTRLFCEGCMPTAEESEAASAAGEVRA